MLNRNGFTLIELLVVITIIVVLLALLTPALDKAVYQVAMPCGDSTRRADLATCGARLKGVANGVTVRAAQNRCGYPPPSLYC